MKSHPGLHDFQLLILFHSKLNVFFFAKDACFLSVAQEKDTSLYRPALEELRRQIRSSTTSMTSVPKPLKFLRPHYAKLKEIYQNMAAGENKVLLRHQLCVSCFIG